ncbi:polysaccharide biosynthesis tyrosine autokinase [Oscillatoria sp. HE19RPO]|uniref:GumC family protein n=1 Tax=Oscillatoria sp. HE19RPO TaxID=2954806 RepID=UPI0020C375BC|nr:polysaccharide biosynthesis tyrosine autokinase [Oscillatoria sp. HE19RPO]
MNRENYSSVRSSNPNEKIPRSFPSPYGMQPLGERSDEEKVLREISKILAAAKRRALVIIGVAILVTTAMYYQKDQKPASYKGGFQLLVEPVSSAENRLQSILSQTEGSQRETINTRDFSLDYGTQIRVLKSPKVMFPITQKIQERYPKFTPDKIKIDRPFDESEGTRILDISYAGSTAEEVEFVLNVVAEAYLKYSLEDRQTNLSQGIMFIENQVPQMRERVDIIQEEIKNLREQYDLMIPEFHSNKLVDQLRAVEMRRIEIQLNLSDTRSLYQTIRTLFEAGDYAAVLGESGGTYGPLISQIHKLDSDVTAAASRMQEEHPTLRSLREQKQNLEAPVRQEAQSILSKLEGRLQGLQENEEILLQNERRLKQQLDLLPAVASNYDRLQRELQIANETLNKNLIKLDGLRLDAAQQKVPWDLIAPPTSLRVPTTNRKAIILTAVLGLILGMGVAFVLEILNNVFHNPDDIEEDTRLPLLGVIPFSNKLKKLKDSTAGKPKKLLPVASGSLGSQTSLDNLRLANSSHIQPSETSPLVEAFRSLYTNIRLLNADTPLHSMVISAATPGEGKSTVAVHLAQTAAAIGQRVLLVDADMRSPKIHLKLNLPNLRGLSDTISTDMSLNDAIQRSPIDDNLFVLTSGPLTSDPIKLLSSKKMYSLMEQFQDFFDLVIYDTPPLVGVADSCLLAAQTDGLVMVVKVDKTDRTMVLKALDGLKISGSSVLGVVANCNKK